MTQSLVLGIDIGGTNTAFGIVDRRGRILEKGTIPTTVFDTVAAYISALKEAVTPLLDKAGSRNVTACGVGAPNANFYTGEIVDAANLPWKGMIPLAKLLQEAFRMPVTITNDANAAALGEMMYGAAKGLKDFVMVTLGTGVGSGFVVNGSLMYGHDGFAGELGHVIAVRGGRTCGCGRNGCLETYASATGIVRTAEEWLLHRSEESVLRRGGKITAKRIQEAAAGGDALALEIMSYTARILGEALADMVTITSPAAIIFFGGLAKAGALLLEPARTYMELNLLHIYRNKIAFLVSDLPDTDAALLGASALAW